MVKANELRVGNWLFYKNDTYVDRPNKIHPNWFQVDYIGETIGLDIGFEATQRFEKKPIWSPKITELKPITITSEILQKFGFEYDHDQLGMTFRCGKLVMFYDGEGFGRNFGMDADDDRMDVNVRYLHQLQNLYFALTNEELILHIKELK